MQTFILLSFKGRALTFCEVWLCHDYKCVPRLFNYDPTHILVTVAIGLNHAYKRAVQIDFVELCLNVFRLGIRPSIKFRKGSKNIDSTQKQGFNYPLTHPHKSATYAFHNEFKCLNWSNFNFFGTCSCNLSLVLRFSTGLGLAKVVEDFSAFFEGLSFPKMKVYNSVSERNQICAFYAPCNCS